MDVEQSVSLSESMRSTYVAPTVCFLNFCGLKGSWEDSTFLFSFQPYLLVVVVLDWCNWEFYNGNPTVSSRFLLLTVGLWLLS